MEQAPLSITVVGASGDLARKKVFPALFSLYCQGYLPSEFRIFGFARSPFDDKAFRELITEHLTCRYTPGVASCAEKMDTFLSRCFYVAGQYDSRDAFLDLYQAMQNQEPQREMNRLFYLAIPPSIFMDVANAIGDAGFVQCGSGDPWSRVVIEKPFGKDRTSSDALIDSLGKVFDESQTYRIDHYLGKEVIQNLMVLRFANHIFEPIWNRDHISGVQIAWSEDIGVEGRGGYFDEYGILRDVMQNHLLQILALTAMEPPGKLTPAHIMDQKVRLLDTVRALSLEDLVIGQYAAAEYRGVMHEGYRQDPTVPDDSLTATFSAARLHLDNSRWKGVPFILSAGKGLNVRKTEIRVRFRTIDDNIFCTDKGCPLPNELVIRVQPDEAITLRVSNKVPGMGMQVESRELDLQYRAAFNEIIPDAYESLILDVIRGDKSLFIRDAELRAAWDIFTPVLRQIEGEALEPVFYPFGSSGPSLAALGL